jgi:hypothetical protein
MDPVDALEPRTKPGRRRRPVPAFVTAMVSAAAAYVLVQVLADRIIRVGPLDAAVGAVLLATVAFLCTAASLVGLTARAAKGRIAELVHGSVVVPVIVVCALALTAIVDVAMLLAVVKAPQVRLDAPRGSPRYIVVPFTFGETSLTLYRGDGLVYERVDTQLPYVKRSSQFADTYRVETDADGRLHLRYPQEDGKEADVLLP